MTFTRYVQVGRVAYIAYGADQGKLATIVDVVDQNRALIDGPDTDVKRQLINFKALHLTKFLIKIPHGARQKTLRNAWKKAEITTKWGSSSWAKRLQAKQVRENLSDFERFKLMKAKQARNRMITLEVGKLRLKAKKEPKKEKKVVAKKPAAKPAAAPAPKKKWRGKLT